MKKDKFDARFYFKDSKKKYIGLTIASNDLLSFYSGLGLTFDEAYKMNFYDPDLDKIFIEAENRNLSNVKLREYGVRADSTNNSKMLNLLFTLHPESIEIDSNGEKKFNRFLITPRNCLPPPSDKKTGKRKYIMVQSPEPCNPKSEAFKAGYKTISEIGRERIRRASQKIINDLEDKIEVIYLKAEKELSKKKPNEQLLDELAIEFVRLENTIERNDWGFKAYVVEPMISK